MEYFDLVEQECPAPTGSAAFDFSASGALTGRFTFDSRFTTTGQTGTYTARDASGNVETGLGTWNETAKTLTRTTIYSSSNGDAAESFSGTVTVAMDWLSDEAKNAYVAVQTVQPGGRLTLTSGEPVTVSDVTYATTIYYTPYLHDVIPLWNGASWELVQFSETSLALGTITSGLPYDVFGYLSGGALALELLAWTDNTNRATAITLQDGQYCKSGDHTRLYLGSFYTTSTTTTEDSASKRHVWNMFNRVVRHGVSPTGVSHTLGSSSAQVWNMGSGLLPRCSFMCGVVDSAVDIQGFGRVERAGTYNAALHVYLNGTSAGIGFYQAYTSLSTGSATSLSMSGASLPRLGYNYLDVYETGYDSNSKTVSNGRTAYVLSM